MPELEEHCPRVAVVLDVDRTLAMPRLTEGTGVSARLREDLEVWELLLDRELLRPRHAED